MMKIIIDDKKLKLWSCQIFLVNLFKHKTLPNHHMKIATD